MRKRVAALTGTAPGKLVLTLAIAVLGWWCARVLDVGDLTHSQLYLYLATGLLAIGLYSSTQDIDLREARHGMRTVLVAVTLGVGAKALLIAGVMYVVFRRPEYLILGVAVAQIDPLSVAAMQLRSRMSERAKAVLLAWASFDDPVTTLLTIYLSGLTLSMLHGGRPAGHGLASDGTLASFGIGLAQSVAFAAAALLLWVSLRRVRAMTGRPGAAPAEARRRRFGHNAVAVTALLGLITVAVWQFVMLGLALTGLFFRPALGKWAGRLTGAAFLLAVFALGLLLGPGIQLVQGVVLGVAAFAAQAVVALLIARRQSRDDRVYLALGQQNGITAIILALLLEPNFPGTVGIVGPAILVVNLLNIVTNATWDRRDGLVTLVAGFRPRVARTRTAAARAAGAAAAATPPAPTTPAPARTVLAAPPREVFPARMRH